MSRMLCHVEQRRREDGKLYIAQKSGFDHEYRGQQYLQWKKMKRVGKMRKTVNRPQLRDLLGYATASCPPSGSSTDREEPLLC